MIALALSLSFAMQPADLAELQAQRIAGRFGPAELRDNLVATARLHAESGDAEAAERALAVAVRVDKNLVLDDGLLLLAPILEKVRAQPGGLSFSLEQRKGELIISLDVDDLALVAGAEVELGERVLELALTQETPTARAPLEGAMEFGVFLVDEYGNVLAGTREVGSTKAPPKTAPEVKVEPASSAMTTTGGVLALSGLVVFAGSAGTAATLAQDPEAGFLPPLLFGVGLVGAAAGTIGIGLMALGDS